MNTNDKSFSRIKLAKKETKSVPGQNVQQDPNFSYSFGRFLSDVGNKGIGQLFEAGLVQAKLRVSQPQDASELEADRIANTIVSGNAVNGSQVSKADMLQRKGNLAEGSLAASTESNISGLEGKGSPLSHGLKSYFEPRLGVDLDKVRIHKDSVANRLSQSIHAKAFTLGNDIAFDKGEYRPDTIEGKKLLAHELAHVMQQEQSPLQNQIIHRMTRTVPERKTPDNPKLVTPDISKRGGDISINRIGIMPIDDPLKSVHLWLLPDTSSKSKQLKKLAFNEKVLIHKELTSPRNWYFVTTSDGLNGYVNKNFIWTDIPETGAFLYRVQKDDNPIRIVNKFYGHIQPDLTLARYIAMLIQLNSLHGQQGIHYDSKNQAQADIGSMIWIISPDYAKSIINTVELKNTSIIAEIRFLEAKLTQIQHAIDLSLKYMPDAIARHVVADLQELLLGLVQSLLLALIILEICTLLGAAIGTLIGPEGTVAGGAIGFEIGLDILEALGLAMLMVWVGQALLNLGTNLSAFLTIVWKATGNVDDVEKQLDIAGKQFAECVGIFVGDLVQAAIMFALYKGLKNTKGDFEKIDEQTGGKFDDGLEKAIEEEAEKKPYSKHRPSYKNGQVERVWENAKQADGKVYDPFTGEELFWDKTKPRDGQWDMGHRTPYKALWERYMKGDITKEDFLREYQDPANYFPQSVSGNRGRTFD